MAKTSRAAAARAAAAAAEKGGSEITVRWRKLELVVPARLPLAVAFDLAEAEEDSGGLDQQTLFRVLRAVLGRDQFRQVRNAIADESISIDEGVDVLLDLFQTVTASYGLSPGESSASDGS